MVEKTSTAKRLLHAIDRVTLVTMNPPAPTRNNDRVNAASITRPAAHAADVDHTDILEETKMSTTELDLELEALRQATVWQLNSALESGWDDAAQSISDSYTESQRSLLGRRRHAQAA
jgi:hypothetical protein